jgi:membrane fusion protein, multidrug efflux system
VRADIPNPDRRLRPGMLLTVRLQQAARDVLVVPELALVQVGTTQSVFRVIEDETVEQVTVQSGSRRRGEVEIVSGLSLGDRIVVEGVGKMRPGMPVIDASRVPPADVSLNAMPTPRGGGVARTPAAAGPHLSPPAAA